jgi:hypothetical protein
VEVERQVNAAFGMKSLRFSGCVAAVAAGRISSVARPEPWHPDRAPDPRHTGRESRPVRFRPATRTLKQEPCQLPGAATGGNAGQAQAPWFSGGLAGVHRESVPGWPIPSGAGDPLPEADCRTTLGRQLGPAPAHGAPVPGDDPWEGFRGRIEGKNQGRDVICHKWTCSDSSEHRSVGRSFKTGSYPGHDHGSQDH